MRKYQQSLSRKPPLSRKPLLSSVRAIIKLIYLFVIIVSCSTGEDDTYGEPFDIGLDLGLASHLHLKGVLLIRIGTRDVGTDLNNKGGTILCDFDNGTCNLLELSAISPHGYAFAVTKDREAVFFTEVTSANKVTLGLLNLRDSEARQFFNEPVMIYGTPSRSPFYDAGDGLIFYSVNTKPESGPTLWSPTKTCYVNKIDVRTGEVIRLTPPTKNLDVVSISDEKDLLLIEDRSYPYWRRYFIYDYKGNLVKQVLPFQYFSLPAPQLSPNGSFVIVPQCPCNFQPEYPQGNGNGRSESDLLVYSDGEYYSLNVTGFVFGRYCISPDAKWVLTEEFENQVNNIPGVYLTLVRVETGERYRLGRIPDEYRLYYFFWNR